MKLDFVIVSWTLKVSIFFKSTSPFRKLKKRIRFIQFDNPDKNVRIYFSTEYPHKFTSKLKGQNVVEHDQCEFEIDVEASDAEVTWCLNGKPIQADDSR